MEKHIRWDIVTMDIVARDTVTMDIVARDMVTMEAWMALKILLSGLHCCWSFRFQMESYLYVWI